MKKTGLACLIVLLCGAGFGGAVGVFEGTAAELDDIPDCNLCDCGGVGPVFLRGKCMGSDFKPTLKFTGPPDEQQGWMYRSKSGKDKLAGNGQQACIVKGGDDHSPRGLTTAYEELKEVQAHIKFTRQAQLLEKRSAYVLRKVERYQNRVNKLIPSPVRKKGSDLHLSHQLRMAPLWSPSGGGTPQGWTQTTLTSTCAEYESMFRIGVAHSKGAISAGQLMRAGQRADVFISRVWSANKKNPRGGWWDPFIPLKGTTKADYAMKNIICPTWNPRMDRCAVCRVRPAMYFAIGVGQDGECTGDDNKDNGERMSSGLSGVPPLSPEADYGDPAGDWDFVVADHDPSVAGLQVGIPFPPQNTVDMDKCLPCKLFEKRLISKEEFEKAGEPKPLPENGGSYKDDEYWAGPLTGDAISTDGKVGTEAFWKAYHEKKSVKIEGEIAKEKEVMQKAKKQLELEKQGKSPPPLKPQPLPALKDRPALRGGGKPLPLRFRGGMGDGGKVVKPVAHPAGSPLRALRAVVGAA